MKMVLALLGGAAIGAGAALLMAPQTGRATRAMLQDKATKYGHDLQDLVESKGEHLRNKMQGCRHMAAEVAEKATEFGGMAAEHGQEIMDHGRRVVDKARSAVNSVLDTDPDEVLV
jgi:gas vesicle protein